MSFPEACKHTSGLQSCSAQKCWSSPSYLWNCFPPHWPSLARFQRRPRFQPESPDADRLLDRVLPAQRELPQRLQMVISAKKKIPFNCWHELMKLLLRSLASKLGNIVLFSLCFLNQGPWWLLYPDQQRRQRAPPLQPPPAGLQLRLGLITGDGRYTHRHCSGDRNRKPGHENAKNKKKDAGRNK